jgi:hypothetical protein
VFIIENGQPIEIDADGIARRGQPVRPATSSSTGCRSARSGEIVLRDRRALANDGMFMVVVTVDKQTGNVVGRPEIITRGFVHQNEQDPMMGEAIERILTSIQNPGDHISEIALLKSQIKDGVLALPVRADEAPADGLPGRGRGLTWRRTRTPGPRSTARAGRAPSCRPLPSRRSGRADVARSIVGICFSSSAR